MKYNVEKFGTIEFYDPIDENSEDVKIVLTNHIDEESEKKIYTGKEVYDIVYEFLFKLKNLG